VTLTLEVEWLTGVCPAARDPADPDPDWPVQPDRLFSALVASWGLTGAAPAGAEALDWLAAQDPPRLFAVSGAARTTATAFVPPNDAAATDIRILPDRRRRQPRQHPARVLGDLPAHLRLVWDAMPDPALFAVLDRLARDTSYVGHSTALVRCRFVAGDRPAPGELKEEPTVAAPYPGRRTELEQLFERHQKGDERARPARATLTRARRPADEAAPPESLFGEAWRVLLPEGRAPELTIAAHLAGDLRRWLMGAWGDPLPEWLSGHAADGLPSAHPHLAIVPLANVGWEHADGALKGVALVVPREVEQSWSPDTPAGFAARRRFDAALAAIGGKGWVVADAGALKSLSPGRYFGPAKRWATVTPIALDRHPKGELSEEAAAQIAEACTRIGLPAPVAVRPAKHSAVRGAPSAWPVGGAPRWTGWKRPDRLGARPIVHAVIEFGEVVRGPVLLGAGRFRGLGLCLPLR
jgi:CRISPR-associated protein Csb2